MYIVRETFLLVSRFLLPQFVYRPIKKKKKNLLFTRVSLREENEYWILNCLENSISKSKEKLESNTNLWNGTRIRSCPIFLQIFSLIDFSNEYPRVIWFLKIWDRLENSISKFRIKKRKNYLFFWINFCQVIFKYLFLSYRRFWTRITFSRSNENSATIVKISVFQVTFAIRGVNYRLVNLNKLLVAIGETKNWVIGPQASIIFTQFHRKTKKTFLFMSGGDIATRSRAEIF